MEFTNAGTGSATAVAVKPAATTADSGFKNATRTQESILAPFEKRFLIWTAKRLPAWIGPDSLTILGFAGQIAAGVFYSQVGKWPPFFYFVNLCIFINWFGDSLDGTVARVRNKQRPRYGFYVDHVVDVLGAFALMTGLGFSGYITPMVAAALLVCFLMFSAETYLSSYAVGNFKLSYFKFSPTEIRVLLIIGNMFAVTRPVIHVFHRPYKFFDVGCAIAAVCMFVTLIISAIRNIRYLYRVERV